MLSPASLLRRLPTMTGAVTALAIVALATIGARSWLASRDSITQLSTTIAAQTKLLDQATAREQQRDAALSLTLKNVADAKLRVQTAAEAAAEIPSVLPPLPAPVTVDLPEPTPAVPEPPATANVPQSDLKPFYDYLQDCRACQARLSTAESDLTDERSRSAALTTERDAALKAAHGGAFWSRVRRNAKWFLIGGAVGAIAAFAKH